MIHSQRLITSIQGSDILTEAHHIQKFPTGTGSVNLPPKNYLGSEESAKTRLWYFLVLIDIYNVVAFLLVICIVATVQAAKEERSQLWRAFATTEWQPVEFIQNNAESMERFPWRLPIWNDMLLFLLNTGVSPWQDILRQRTSKRKQRFPNLHVPPWECVMTGFRVSLKPKAQ